MTRYSRSVMPGRGAGEPQDVALDRMMFGAKRKGGQAANDAHEPDFLPPMPDDDADLMVGRASAERRASHDRRTPLPDRRKSPAGRRNSEYVPLREGPRTGDDGRRGPLLLAGALLIVIVFAVVVWNAYSDGVQSDTVEVAPELSTSGAFKTPPREVAEAPAAAETASAEPAVEDLAGPPPGAAGEERPATPAPSKFTAPPPPSLKAPVTPTPDPVQAAAAPKPVVVQPPAQQPAPKPVAAATPPPATQPAAAGAYKPAFQSYGDHVVQIAATSSEASAATEWSRLQKAHPDLLSSAERFIQQADVNGRTVYRLRVGSFASKADAVAFCTAFKTKGGNCLPAVK